MEWNEWNEKKETLRIKNLQGKEMEGEECSCQDAGQGLLYFSGYLQRMTEFRRASFTYRSSHCKM